MAMHHLGQPAKHLGFLEVEKRCRQFMQSSGKASVIHGDSETICVAPKQNGGNYPIMM